MKPSREIGIMTFWESNDNYGQQLQAWALQQELLHRGHHPYLIRYRWATVQSPGQRIKIAIKKILTEGLYLLHLQRNRLIRRYIPGLSRMEGLWRHFPKFRKRNLIMSKQIYTSLRELQDHPPKADYYITGSDQVWNYLMPKEALAAFFLQFGDEKVKRMAYAPSIAHNNYPYELQNTLQKYLSRFDYLSVREEAGVYVCRAVGYEAQLVLDPTLLLSAEDYLQLAEDKTKGPAVFIYSMNYTSQEDIPYETICGYAKDHQVPVVVIPGSGFEPVDELFDNVQYEYATIPEWLSRIRSAELVVTASFHGVVFALLFHRPFLFTPLKGKHVESNARAVELLEKMGLAHCIYSEQWRMSDSFAIHWDEVENRLTQQRKQSKEFLSCIK